MFSTRLIAFVVASVAALAVVNGAPPISTPNVDALNVPANSSSTANVNADAILACYHENFLDCDYIYFPEDACVQLPKKYVNNLASVKVPQGWYCTFWDTDGFCTGGYQTTIIGESPRLDVEHFENVADQFKCSNHL